MESLHALLPHAPGPGAAATDITVALRDTTGDALQLHFRMRGARAVESLKPAMTGGRRDGIWRHTCCELFVLPAGGTGYREFNFSPHGAWAAYDFSAYRAGMQAAALQRDPVLQLTVGDGEWTLAVSLVRKDLCLNTCPPRARLQLGLCAVIEPPGGALAYWALRHPAAAPDFHHRDAMVVEWD
jgi:hypothetical protein